MMEGEETKSTFTQIRDSLSEEYPRIKPQSPDEIKRSSSNSMVDAGIEIPDCTGPLMQKFLPMITKEEREIVSQHDLTQDPITWPSYLYHCGAGAQRRNQDQSTKYFEEKFQDRLVCWAGVVSNLDVAAKRLQIRMAPSEAYTKRFGWDVTLIFSESQWHTSIGDKAKDVVDRPKHGSWIVFFGILRDQGGILKSHTHVELTAFFHVTRPENVETLTEWEKVVRGKQRKRINTFPEMYAKKEINWIGTYKGVCKPSSYKAIPGMSIALQIQMTPSFALHSDLELFALRKTQIAGVLEHLEVGDLVQFKGTLRDAPAVGRPLIVSLLDVKKISKDEENSVSLTGLDDGGVTWGQFADDCVIDFHRVEELFI